MQSHSVPAPSGSSAAAPVALDLVLLGGGHSHALVARMLAAEPIAGARVTMVSDVSYAPYSGMLPGYVAGRYGFTDAHIDLQGLCARAGITFVGAAVTGLDLAKKRIALKDRPSLRYDLLSLNTGGMPLTAGVPGAATVAVPVKPVQGFLERWEQVLAAGKDGGPLVIVGAGLGGVELALAVRARLGAAVSLTVVDQAPVLVPAHASGARRRLTRALAAHGIATVLGQAVVKVEAGALFLADGRQLAFRNLFWSTGIGGPGWLANSGLALDGRGLVRVDDTLTAIGQPGVFAAGDVAVIEHQPRPRSGVFAVRQAAPLLANLRLAAQALPSVLPGPAPRGFGDLIPIKLQRHYLSLVSTADGRAVATRGAFAGSGRWAWRLKDHIDKKFMRQFMPQPRAAGPRGSGRTAMAAQPRCLGCGAKVGAEVLSAALARLRADLRGLDLHQDGSVVLGMDEPDDAAALAVPPGELLVQSVDYLPALVTDPYVAGRITAAHAFSDLFAMGARPHSAQAIVNLQAAAPALMEEHLYQLLSGVQATLVEIGAVLLGGHTTEAPEAALGLAVNGLVAPGTLLRKGGLASGDALILTKAIGTGALFAAAMGGQASGRWLEAAVASMVQTNAAAARILRDYGVRACTDVTGFGLAGHLGEMAVASGAGIDLELAAVPLLPGAATVAALGVRSSLFAANRRAPAVTLSAAVAGRAEAELLFDPQTSGGLVAGVPAARADACVAALQAAGCRAARIIGKVSEVKGEPWIHVS